MKIGVISDTHGNLVRTEQAILEMGQIDALLHAGDFGEGFKELSLPFPSYYVRGNCDWDELGTPEELTIRLGGQKILLTHGHKYDIKVRLTKLQYLAEQENAQIVVFGHSHIPLQEEREGVLFLNPGSLSRPRASIGPSYAIITIEEDGSIGAEILPLKKVK